MRRFILFAAFQWFGILAICQSITTIPGTAPASPDTPMAPQSLFNLNGTHFEPVGSSFLSTQQGSMPSCDSSRQSQNKASAQVDLNQLFSVSCMNMKPEGVAIVRIEIPPSPLSTRRWPDAHYGPIPTQWPNAKVEQIPGTWPNLKMLPIAGQNSSLNPSK
jgi:hypothetical protein